VAERDRRGPGGRARPNAMPGGSTRPREAPRPGRSNRPDGATVILSTPTFVAISADEERQAVEALAELLVPLLAGPPRTSADHDAPSDGAPTSGEH
jgi:hypothetical protein